MRNTEITYRYRDADNYKTSNTIILKGRISETQILDILNKLEDGENFIPEQVGLEPLQKELQKSDSQDWDVDHPWHELEEEDFQPTCSKPTLELTANQLYEKFMSVVKWEDDKKVKHILEEEEKKYALCFWTIEDIQERRPDWTDEQCAKFLEENEDAILDSMTRIANETIDDLLD